MTRSKHLLAAFVLFLSVLVVTHIATSPGSLAHLLELTQGQPILDLKPSFSSAETYARLDAFGELGRQMYMRTMLTIDTIFPLSAFLFLFLLSRYASRRLALTRRSTNALSSLSIGYVALDFLENAIIAILLTRYPERLDLLASGIGYLTVAKRISMFGALLLPPLMLLAANLRALKLSCVATSVTAAQAQIPCFPTSSSSPERPARTASRSVKTPCPAWPGRRRSCLRDSGC